MNPTINTITMTIVSLVLAMTTQPARAGAVLSPPTVMATENRPVQLFVVMKETGRDNSGTTASKTKKGTSQVYSPLALATCPFQVTERAGLKIARHRP